MGELNMHTLWVGQALWKYPIYIGENLLACRNLFDRHLKSRCVAVVTTKSVATLYFNTLKATLSDYQVTDIILPDGEQAKNLATIAQIFDALMANQHDRQTTLIALGGGVVGDITGFAAACYMRGVDYIQVPTTLLAQVDSSVGGKTGVNHPKGKNIIGAFKQPVCVISDLATLQTLPPRELAAGMAEVIKYGLIADVHFYEWVHQHATGLQVGQTELLMQAVLKSCAIKGEVVSEDEKEQGHRAILNFGHTFGHGIEAFLNYQQWLHGEAVAAGMCMALAFSRHQCGQITAHNEQELKQLLQAFALPIKPPQSMTADDFINVMKNDKKVIDGKLHFCLLQQIGHAYITDRVSRQSLLRGMKDFI